MAKKTIKPDYSITSLRVAAGALLAQGLIMANADDIQKAYIGVVLVIASLGAYVLNDHMKVSK